MKIPVDVKKISNIKLPIVQQTQISNIPIFYTSGLEQPITKIEIVYNAGDSFSENPLVAVFTCSLLLEGTKNLTSKQFAEQIDYIAAELLSSTFFELSSISMVSLNKHFNTAISLLNESINYPRFDIHDFNIHKENTFKKLQIDLNNVNIISRRVFFKNIFSNHPYGNIIENHHFDKIHKEQLHNFYHRLYNADNATIYLSGRVNDEILNILNKQLSMPQNITHKKAIEAITSNNTQKVFVEKSDAVQSAIKIGKIIISQQHPDFIPLQITSFVLGGYFGSRLMKKLREEKGYTYGIYSQIFSHKNTNVLIISTEVIADYTKEAIQCIYNEINKLCQEKISEYELENVRSYLLGRILRSFEGPFNSMEVFKNLHLNNLDMNFYYKYFDWLNKITPDIILSIAQRYLSNHYLEVVVGKLN